MSPMFWSILVLFYFMFAFFWLFIMSSVFMFSGLGVGSRFVISTVGWSW